MWSWDISDILKLILQSPSLPPSFADSSIQTSLVMFTAANRFLTAGSVSFLFISAFPRFPLVPTKPVSSSNKSSWMWDHTLSYTNTQPQKCYSTLLEQGRHQMICAALPKFKYVEAAGQNVLYGFVSVEIWKRFLLTDLRAKRPTNHQDSLTELVAGYTNTFQLVFSYNMLITNMGKTEMGSHALTSTNSQFSHQNKKRQRSSDCNKHRESDIIQGLFRMFPLCYEVT